MQHSKRAWTVDNVEKKKFDELSLPKEWEAFIGSPEASGVWIIWGESGSGKTGLTMAVAKVLAPLKVAYDSLEMGTSKALQKAIVLHKMSEVKKSFMILNRESIEDLKIRLRKKQAPKVVIIDSVQYADLTKAQYKALKEEFPNVLFIFISHEENKKPKGALAGFIRYDADIKIRVEGYKAFPVSRFGGGEPYIIYPKGAAEYWADIA